MGVNGLWKVVHPSARPTNLSTLHRRRLAVDASIWIYQFLKAVRDKEGNALRNSHVVGFFRRICKLLYHGILPVFVFDGGAPALKRQTISNRKRRREGRREDAVRTAGRMLAVQMQRRAEEEEQKRKDRESGRVQIEEELPSEQDMVYVDEIGLSAKERQQNRTFRKKDAYHLPDLDISLAEMGAPNDPRIMSQKELEEYARQFHSGEDINLYDFSKIDFDSPFFLSLPASDRYNILNAARLRSRLRMGYSKEQLDGMFPDRMAFSKFQIERVKERNELTQRLMHINGMTEDFVTQGARIAGEKGKEYMLVRNDGVEGGWVLGVVSNKNEGNKDQPIDLETYGQQVKDEDDEEEWEDQEGFEDVPIEGLNRLPKKWIRKGPEVDYNAEFQDRVEEIARKRREVYEARKKNAKPASQAPAPTNQIEQRAAVDDDPDSLFVPEDSSRARPSNDKDDEDMEELFEDVDIGQGQSDDEDLQKAIEMSLMASGFSDDEQDAFEDANNLTKGESSHDKLRNINQKAESTIPQKASQVQSDDEDFDLQAALAESRKSKYRPKGPERLGHRSNSPAREVSTPKFDGPLPFESLNLGQSLLGKKKAKKIEEELSGGFEQTSTNQKPAAQPLPPWFNAEAPTKTTLREPALQSEEIESSYQQSTTGVTRIRRNETREIIDLDADDSKEPEIIDLDISDRSEISDNELAAEEDILENSGSTDADVLPVGDLSILPTEQRKQTDMPGQITEPKNVPLEDLEPDAVDEVNWSETDEEELAEKEKSRIDQPQPSKTEVPPPQVQTQAPDKVPDEDDDDEDVEFEDVETAKVPAFVHQESTAMDEEQLARAEALLIMDDSDGNENDQLEQSGTVEQPSARTDEDNYFSDEDDELFHNLAIEAEEHARFVSTLNNSLEPLPESGSRTALDYEAELLQLRNQQKRDRRDADEVTQTMIQECQMLLALFGLPYITAPMEAEAQCAELVRLGLVDGIITDDSDVFLFGGTRIYKNMFNAAKYVECYLTSDLEREYSLTREKLISFAHLLGSDYTEGIPGVGPVTALEILTEFPDEDGGLIAFRDWWSKAQLTDPRTVTPETEPHYAFLKKYRKQLTKLFLPPHFPDKRVEEAYLLPEVDSDPQQFQWGVPDLNSLRRYLMSTIGWSQERTDEILVPVIRDMNRREVEGTQSNITRFFGGGIGVGARLPQSDASRGSNTDDREIFAPRVRESSRMQKAFGRLKGQAERNRKRNASGNITEENTSLTTEENTNDTSSVHTATDDPDSSSARKQRTTKKRKTTTTTKTSTAKGRGKASTGSTRSGRKTRQAIETDEDEQQDEDDF